MFQNSYFSIYCPVIKMSRSAAFAFAIATLFVVGAARNAHADPFQGTWRITNGGDTDYYTFTPTGDGTGVVTMAPGSSNYYHPVHNSGSPWPYTYTEDMVNAWGLTGTLSGGTISWNNGVTYYCNGVCGAGAANCTFNGQTVASGGSVTAYQSNDVPHDQTCQSETRTCNNGTLSGSYAYPACIVSFSPAADVH